MGGRNGMVMRRFVTEDLDQALSLFRDTVHRVNARDYGPEDLEAWAPDEPDREAWMRRLGTGVTYVVEREGRMLGFGSLASDGTIDTLYVGSEHQGKGVGAALLARLLAEAEAAGHTSARTEASLTARPFFEKLGFTVVREQVKAVRGRNIANVVMTRLLGRDDGEEDAPSA